MKDTSFLAFFNTAGIACASSQDKSIYSLSKEEPIALAVNPGSMIPWETIINKYQSMGEPAHRDTVEAYALDFEAFLKNQPVEAKWNNLSTQDANIIFMGFGKDDIYASVFDVIVTVDEETHALSFGFSETNQVTLSNCCFWNLLGDFDYISAVLYGSRRNVRELCVEKGAEVLDIFRERIREASIDSNIDPTNLEKLLDIDCEKEACKIVNNATDTVINNAKLGLETFSIEELVYAVEKLVNANIRMARLMKGNNEPRQEVKEIAVITRTEGLTWIKHCLFAR